MPPCQGRVTGGFPKTEVKKMAGDWIKFEHATLDKPEVLVLADYMETTPDDVIGKLLRVWVWFDKNSINGDAGGVTNVTLMKFIDRLVDRNGFAACLKKVGWLSDSGVPNFDRHNGESAKKRALTNKRTKKWRDDSVTQEASPEKRREEKKEHNNICAVVTAPQGFEKFWDAWPKSPRKVAKAACLKKWQALGLETSASVIAAAVEALKQTKQWRDGFEPAPLTFLNQRRWEDGPVESQTEEKRFVI